MSLKIRPFLMITAIYYILSIRYHQKTLKSLPLCGKIYALEIDELSDVNLEIEKL